MSYGTFTSGSSSKMAAQNEPKVYDTTTVAVAGYEDGHKGDGVAGLLSLRLTYTSKSID